LKVMRSFSENALIDKTTQRITTRVFMYWGRLVKIDTALYPISTQRNLAVASENISMPLNPNFYGRVCTSIHR
jgi:hypothetical protein